MADTLHKLLDAQFKVKSQAVDSIVSVTNAQPASLLVRNNPNRVGLAFSNISTASIYISFRPGMGTTEGFLLTPSGGNLILNWRDDFDMVAYDWYAIASVAASNLHIIELILDSQGV